MNANANDNYSLGLYAVRYVKPANSVEVVTEWLSGLQIIMMVAANHTGEHSFMDVKGQLDHCVSHLYEVLGIIQYLLKVKDGVDIAPFPNLELPKKLYSEFCEDSMFNAPNLGKRAIWNRVRLQQLRIEKLANSTHLRKALDLDDYESQQRIKLELEGLAKDFSNVRGMVSESLVSKYSD